MTLGKHDDLECICLAGSVSRCVTLFIFLGNIRWAVVRKNGTRLGVQLSQTDQRENKDKDRWRIESRKMIPEDLVCQDEWYHWAGFSCFLSTEVECLLLFVSWFVTWALSVTEDLFESCKLIWFWMARDGDAGFTLKVIYSLGLARKSIIEEIRTLLLDSS